MSGWGGGSPSGRGGSVGVGVWEPAGFTLSGAGVTFLPIVVGIIISGGLKRGVGIHPHIPYVMDGERRPR